MPWYIDDTRIFVTKKNESHKHIIARLQPVGTGTVHQSFGYENRIYKINAYVVGNGNVSELGGKVRDGQTHSFNGTFPGYSFDIDVLVSTMNAEQTNATYQTIDTTQECDAVVWVVDFELFLETDA
jgi:hypothetical protein